MKTTAALLRELKESIEQLDEGVRPETLYHIREDYNEDEYDEYDEEMYGKYEDHEKYYFHATSFTNALQILKDGAIKRSNIRSDDSVCITRSERFANEFADIGGPVFIINKKKLLADTTPTHFDYFKNRNNPYNDYEWEERVKDMDVSLAKYVVGVSVASALDEDPHLRNIYAHRTKNYENFVKAFNASPFSKHIEKFQHSLNNYHPDYQQFSGNEYYDENGDYIGVGDGNEDVYWDG